MPPAVEAWSLNHWTAREVPKSPYFEGNLLKASKEEVTPSGLHPKFSSGCSVDNNSCQKRLGARRLGGGSDRGDEEMENPVKSSMRMDT